MNRIPPLLVLSFVLAAFAATPARAALENEKADSGVKFLENPGHGSIAAGAAVDAGGAGAGSSALSLVNSTGRAEGLAVDAPPAPKGDALGQAVATAKGSVYGGAVGATVGVIAGTAGGPAGMLAGGELGLAAGGILGAMFGFLLGGKAGESKTGAAESHEQTVDDMVKNL